MLLLATTIGQKRQRVVRWRESIATKSHARHQNTRPAYNYFRTTAADRTRRERELASAGPRAPADRYRRSLRRWCRTQLSRGGNEHLEPQLDVSLVEGCQRGAPMDARSRHH